MTEKFEKMSLNVSIGQEENNNFAIKRTGINVIRLNEIPVAVVLIGKEFLQTVSVKIDSRTIQIIKNLDQIDEAVAILSIDTSISDVLYISQ